MIQGVDGQIQLNWGLGIGGFLLLLSGIILIFAGIFERLADVEFFKEKEIIVPEENKKSNEENKKSKKE
jgi:hypothetical protein